jgi:hypothetical protein
VIGASASTTWHWCGVPVGPNKASAACGLCSAPRQGLTRTERSRMAAGGAAALRVHSIQGRRHSGSYMMLQGNTAEASGQPLGGRRLTHHQQAAGANTAGRHGASAALIRRSCAGCTPIGCRNNSEGKPWREGNAGGCRQHPMRVECRFRERKRSKNNAVPSSTNVQPPVSKKLCTRVCGQQHHTWCHALLASSLASSALM